MLPSSYSLDARSSTRAPPLGSAPTLHSINGEGQPSASSSTSRPYGSTATNQEGLVRSRGASESSGSGCPEDEGASRKRPRAHAGGAGRKKGQEISLACYNCRSRKVKCDSQRPSCSKCVARGDDCDYDKVMKRRGPDKGKRRGLTEHPAQTPVRTRPTASPPARRQPPPPPPSVRSSIGRPTSPEHIVQPSPSASHPSRSEPYQRRPSQSSSTTSSRRPEWSPPPSAWQPSPSSFFDRNGLASSPRSSIPFPNPASQDGSFPHPLQAPQASTSQVRLPPMAPPHPHSTFPPSTYTHQPTARRSTLPFALFPLSDPVDSMPTRRQSSYTPSLASSSLAMYQPDPAHAHLPAIRQGARTPIRITDLMDSSPEPRHMPLLPSPPPQLVPPASLGRSSSPASSATAASQSHPRSVSGWTASSHATSQSWGGPAPTISEADAEMWNSVDQTTQGRPGPSNVRKEDDPEDDQAGRMVARPSSRARLGLEDLLSPQPQTFQVHLPSSVFGQDQTSPLGYFNPPMQSPASPFRPPRAGTPILYQTPTLEYLREIWFDVLLNDLATSFQAGSGAPPRSREGARRMMLNELATLWKVSQHWVSFIHVPTLMGRMLSVEGRRGVQPSLIYILLALAINLNSYEGPGGRGFQGSLLALRLREEAEGIMWSSYHGSGEFHEDFAKVAFLIMLFELSAHPLVAAKRREAALWSLDRMMLRLSVDPYVGVRDLEAPLFAPGEMPHILPPPHGFAQPVQPLSDLTPYALRPKDGSAFAFWGATPRWPDENTPYGSPLEIRKEQTRRLIWSAAALGANMSVWRFNLRMRPLDLFICRPDSYAIFLPAENLFFEPGAARSYARSNVWALQAITYLLWDYAIGLMHSDLPQTYKDAKSMEIWEETLKIERLFDADGLPGSEFGLLWQQRDWMINIRTCVSERFTRAIPLTPGRTTKEVVKEMALVYLGRQGACAKAMLAATRSDGKAAVGVPVIRHRSGHIFILIMQACRALDIFSSDHSIVEALAVIRNDFLPIVEMIAGLYPSAGINLSIQIFLSLVNPVYAKVSAAILARMPPELAEKQTEPAFPPLTVQLPYARSVAEVETLLMSLTSGGVGELDDGGF